ncbi:hypothetical protein L6R52_27270 [Myxococcota bacterium]|nr:hypothetical protein [Myxococcota bacterium]
MRTHPYHLRGLSLALASALALVACGETITVVDSGFAPDATTGADGGGTGDDGGTTFPDATTTPDGGDGGSNPVPDSGAGDGGPIVEPDGGGEPFDGGAEGMPELTWGSMTLPANTASVLAIWGRSSAEIYAGTSNGKLLRFAPQVGWLQVWETPTNFAIRAIGGTTSRLFVCDEGNFYVFTLGFNPSQEHPIGRTVRDMYVSSDSEVLFVADQTNGRGLYRWNGTTVNTLNEPTDVATLASVFVTGTGVTYVGGNGKLYNYAAMTLTEESVLWPAAWGTAEIANFEFTSIGIVASQLFAAGSRNLIFRRELSGRWELMYAPFSADGEIHAIAGYPNGIDPEGYAVGNATSESSILRFYKLEWRPSSYQGNVDLHDLWTSNMDEYYAVGNVNNTFDGVILRGTR